MSKDSTKYVGVDLGDESSEVCVTDASGRVIERHRVKTDRNAMKEFFGTRAPMVVAMEVGTPSPWASRLLKRLGHDVVVANPRNVHLISKSNKKNDRSDAELLARLVRVDRGLLSPVEHRREEDSEELLTLKARDVLVRSRTQQINFVRQVSKSTGSRLPKCSAETFPKQARAKLEATHLESLQPVLSCIEMLTSQIRRYDEEVKRLGSSHADVGRLQTIPGVGPVTSLAFVLVIGDANRFKDARTVGSYLGLRPRQDQSGETDKQLRITKAGNTYLRSLLVGSAQYILGRFGPDSDLKRWGQALSERGGRNAKKRAVVAVARKLSVVMLAMMKTGTSYEPHRIASTEMAA